MSTQTDHLRASLERCGERAAYAERELARLMTSKGGCPLRPRPQEANG